MLESSKVSVTSADIPIQRNKLNDRIYHYKNVIKVQNLSNKLWIHGPSEAPRGNTVTLSCETDVSNPKSELSWTVDGQTVEKAEENVRETTDGWITTSNITITLNRQ
ncbi:hypothetical protein AVEN_176439-1, partial [Araneus ventricosus]